MHILIHKYWNKFKKTIKTNDGKTKTIKDGKQFENLIKAILDLEYGKNHWVDTGKTWDGSRDFEWRTPDFYRWAECKNYAAPISLNVISNTLVMAMVDFADEILIFSYSKIKTPVLKKLIQFADVSQKTLRIYADDSLEEIILKHISDLKNDYFPNFNVNFSDIAQLQPYVSCNIISDPVTAYTLNSDLGCIPLKPDKINFNTTLCLSIFIFNQRSTDVFISINIDWKQNSYCFKIMNQNKKNTMKFKLSGNSTVVKKIYFEAVIYHPTLHFPSVIVSSGDFCKEFSFGTVKCSWIGECTLQGSTYKKIPTDFQSVILTPKFYRAINIYGTSGVGKSRLLKECENIALGYGYRVIRFSLVNKSNNDNITSKIIIEFICALFDIPDLDEYIQTSNSKTLSDIYKIIIDIKTKHFEQDDIQDKVIPVVTRKLMTSKCFITFDNIQYYPGVFIAFINEIVENLLLSNKHCKSRMGFSFNTDYIYSQSECANFYTFLAGNRESIENKKLLGFTTDGETRVFFNQLLSNADIDDLYINKIIKVSQKNPFYIMSYFKTLEAKGILQKRNDCYVIPHYKYRKFKENVSCIPENIRETISNRWISYLDQHDEDESIKILAVIHVFQYLNTELIELFQISKTLIDELYKCHFLKCIENNNISYNFEHDLTEKFFSEKYFPLCKNVFCKTTFIPYYEDYWYKKICDIIYNENISLDDLKQITRKAPPYKIGLEIYTLLIEYIVARINSSDVLENYLQIICTTCANVRELYGTEKSISLYKKVIGKVENDFCEFQANISWAWAMISFANLLYENNCYNDAINCIKNLLLYWPESNISEKNSIIYCYLYNRLHVYNRALKKQITSDCLGWLDKSEKLQNNPEISFLNLIDRGYCKYDCFASKQEILKYWKEACSIYENNELPSKKLNYYYAKMRIHLFNGELEIAKTTIQEGLKAIETKELGTYYFIYFKQRYLMCKIAVLLLDYKPKNNTNIIDIFYEVDDIDYILKGRTSFSIYWLKSIFYFFDHQYLDSFLCIDTAIQTLYQNQKLTFQDVYLKQLYENAKYFMAKSQSDFGFSINLEQLTNRKLIASLKKTIKLSDMEQSNYIKKHQATGLLQTNDYKINFPTL